MKYYKDNSGLTYAYELDGSQDNLIGNKIKLSDDEVTKLLIENDINSTENKKLAEYKVYLNSTDYKMTVDYFATLSVAEQEALVSSRAIAREFIKNNQ
jgi:hypothetical protein